MPYAPPPLLRDRYAKLIIHIYLHKNSYKEGERKPPAVSVLPKAGHAPPARNVFTSVVIVYTVCIERCSWGEEEGRRCVPVTIVSEARPFSKRGQDRSKFRDKPTFDCRVIYSLHESLVVTNSGRSSLSSCPRHSLIEN